MVIEFLNLNDPDLKPFEGANFALIGFQERQRSPHQPRSVGAVEGPHSIRYSSWPNCALASRSETSVSLMSVILMVPNRSLEQLQGSLAKLSSACGAQSSSHRTGRRATAAYGNYLGLRVFTEARAKN